MQKKRGISKSKFHNFFNKFFWFAVVGVIVVVILFFIIIINLQKERTGKEFVCGDGTDYGDCSSNKPYFCDNGTLVERASFCGCPDIEGMDFLKKEDSCISQYHDNPKNLTLDYKINGKNGTLNITVYKDLINYLSQISDSIIYREDETPVRKDFKLKKLDNNRQRVFLMPLVTAIQNKAPRDKTKQARIAVSAVQHIQWGWSDKTRIFNGQKLNYSRYPYEVLMDNQGICGEKSELLTFLLRELGYGVSILYYQPENHEAVGIKCPVEESIDETGYCFVETSGPAIITDNSIEYSGGTILQSEPQVIEISDGISLPKNMYEYRDAETMKKINNQIREKGVINLFQKIKLDDLKEKYGLAEVYNLA